VRQRPKIDLFRREATRLNAAYTPNTLFGAAAYCWLRADTVTIATGVSQMTDKSGNGRHFAQATGAKQPTLVASGADPNGKACVVSNGSSHSLTNAGFGAMNAITMYLVTRSIPTPAALGYLFCVGNPADARSAQFAVTNAGTPRSSFYNPANTLSAWNFSGEDASTSSLRIWSASGTTSNGGATVWEGRVRLGSIGAAGTNASTGNTIVNLASALFASKAGTAGYLAAGLYELIVFDAAHTTEQMRQMELLLAGYYGLYS
jgi:hypothetical protein